MPDAPNTAAPAASQTPSAPASTAPASTAPVTTPTGTAAPGTPPVVPAKPPLDTRTLSENRQLKEKLKQYEAREKELAPKIALLERIKDPAQRWKVAEEELGLSYEEYTQHKLGSLRDAKPVAELSPEQQAKLDRLDAAEKAREEKAAKETQSAQRQTAVEAANRFVEQNAERWPFTKAFNAGEALLDAFTRESQKRGEEPDQTEFGDTHEADLEKAIERNLTAVIATSKGKALVQRLLGIEPPASTTASPKQTGLGTGTKPRAVTNGHSSESGAPPDLRKLSDKELRERAMKKAGLGAA